MPRFANTSFVKDEKKKKERENIVGTHNWISTRSVVTSSSIVPLSVVRIFCNFLTAAIMDVSGIFLGICSSCFDTGKQNRLFLLLFG